MTAFKKSKRSKRFFTLVYLKHAIIILSSKETLYNLLDGSLPSEDLTEIEEIINNYKTCLGFSSVKGRRSGPAKDIEITLLFPKDMTIEKCHSICDEIEDLIRNKLGSCTIIIHAEPENCPKCIRKCKLKNI